MGDRPDRGDSKLVAGDELRPDEDDEDGLDMAMELLTSPLGGDTEDTDGTGDTVAPANPSGSLLFGAQGGDSPNKDSTSLSPSS